MTGDIRGMSGPFERRWSVYADTRLTSTWTVDLTGYRILCDDNFSHSLTYKAQPSFQSVGLEEALRTTDYVVCGTCLLSRRYGTEGVARTRG